MILYAPAKVNLYLRVLGKRPDGYHDIETVFERIALFDKIVLRSLKDDKIKIVADRPDIPTDETSLMHKTVALLKKNSRVSRGAEVKIFKKIPVTAGLGGGSSDAASVLLGLNRLWKLSLDLSRLTRLGRALGADVPFFLSESSFARAKERGDSVTPLNWKKTSLWHLIISPPVKILSKDVYKNARPGKTPSANFIQNDLESVVCKIEPLVSKIKDCLERIGLKYSLVSGSGPSVFSLFERRSEAVSSKERLTRRFPFVKEKGWQIFVAPTL